MQNSEIHAGLSPSRRVQLWELLVFILLIGPSSILSLFVVSRGNLGFVLTAVSTITRDVALVCLIVFFLWRNREPFQRIGWQWRDMRDEALLGVTLFLPVFFAIGELEHALLKLGLSAPSAPIPKFLAAKGSGQFVLASVLVVVVAIAEETVFRGYLILRFSEVTRSTGLAVLFSVILFAIGHGYEGTAGLVSVAVLGLVLALVYVWRQNLVAPVVMHFLQDFLSIVVVPLLRHHG